MKHKISTGVLIFKSDKILLVKHVDPDTGFTWWVPPGGGIKEDESIYDAAKREVLEEAGLEANIGRIVYLRQMIYKKLNSNILTLYLLSNSVKGELTTNNLDDKDLDSKYIKEVRYFSRDEIQNIIVFPEILKDRIWEDYKKGFGEIQFIGIATD